MLHYDLIKKKNEGAGGAWALTKKLKDGDSWHIQYLDSVKASLSESTQQYSSYCLLSSSLVRVKVLSISDE